MKKLGAYLIYVFVITIFLPTVIVNTFNFVAVPKTVEGREIHIGEEVSKKDKKPIVVDGKKIEQISVYNPLTKKTAKLALEEYIKGVVAAEMPAKFHIEALKAQAIAARTYAISRSIKYSEGHPDHKSASLCASVHCQAFLSYDELKNIHGDKWIEDFWPKIEEAVESTSQLALYYNGEIIEPLYHSTSGGKTEDAVHVFAMDSPYLKSVDSPYEEEAPKYKETLTLTVEEFIEIFNKEYKDIKLSKDNFADKIKLVEKTPSGRVKKIAIDNKIIEGRDIRNLLGLNSTNFTIVYNKKLKLIEIETYGYGHGVGMSQWGANGMANEGSNYMEILKHYYSGVEIEKM